MIKYDRARFEGKENSDEFIAFLNDWGLLGFELYKSFESITEPGWMQMTPQEQAYHSEGNPIRRYATDCIFIQRS